MNFAEQTDFRRELHRRILQAVKEYEEQTDWKVKSISYEPGVPHVATEVTEARETEITSDASPRSGARSGSVTDTGGS